MNSAMIVLIIIVLNFLWVLLPYTFILICKYIYRIAKYIKDVVLKKYKRKRINNNTDMMLDVSDLMAEDETEN